MGLPGEHQGGAGSLSRNRIRFGGILLPLRLSARPAAVMGERRTTGEVAQLRERRLGLVSVT